MRVLSLSRPATLRPSLLARIADALELHRQRKRLAHLDALQLDDIGLSSEAALAESRRPIWDAPPHWRL